MVADEKFPEGPVSLPWGRSKGQQGSWERSFRIVQLVLLELCTRLQLYPLSSSSLSTLSYCVSSLEQLYYVKPNFESKCSLLFVVSAMYCVTRALTLILGALLQ